MAYVNPEWLRRKIAEIEKQFATDVRFVEMVNDYLERRAELRRSL